MKKIIVSLLCVSMAFTAFAQFTQPDGSGFSNSRRTSGHGVNTVDARGFNKLYASFSPAKFTISDDGYSWSTSGFQVGLTYTRSQCLANFPLYLELGAGFHYTSFSVDWFGDIKLYSVNVPINLAYRLSLGGGKLHLTPHTGPYFRINVAGKCGENTDIFGDEGIKRVQFGWQEGIAFSVQAFYLNISYTHDLTKALDYDVTNRYSGFNFGIGFVF